MPEQRAELDRVMRRRHGNAAVARRALCVLLLADGHRRVDIRSKLACNDAFISKWMSALQAQGLAGLVSLHPGRTPKTEARVLNRTLKHLHKDGSTHWSSRKLAAELGDVSFCAVQRIWRKHGVRPHRLDTPMVSNDPDFESKAADVIGLYLDPPAHAVVFCVDEKTAIQALDRKDRMLPLSPGRAQSHGFEYKRSGTLSLFAALNTVTGEVLGKTAARHTSEKFVDFLRDIVASQSPRREIHVICDNVSSHKTPLVQAFLTEHRRVHMHYTPTYSSWLNQVENWFARIQGAPEKQAIGRSRGGLSTKIHATVDALGNPTGFHLTPGQAHDLEGADVLLKDTAAAAILADKAYDAQARVIEPLLETGKTIVIAPRSTRVEPRDYDRHVYQARHLIENFFARLKQYRCIGTRFDKTARNFLGAIHLAAAVAWLN